jgi:hypothetical protein
MIARSNWAGLLFSTVLACFTAGLGAFELPVTPPKGPVILKIIGAVGAKNTPDAAAFDAALLDALPQTTYTATTPWFKEPAQFSGPLLRDVLKLAKAQGTLLNATALNDYKALIPMDDVTRYNVILARKMNGKEIAVRDKGPLFVMYPFDTVPELKNMVFFSRSIWQLHTISVQ